MQSRQSAVRSKQLENCYYASKTFNLVVFNSLGKEIERFEITDYDLRHFSIDIQGYPAGIYTLNITGDKFIATKKFIKVH